MIKLKTENFDLEQICRSGQCFRMNQKQDKLYSVIAGRRYLELEQRGQKCIFCCEEAEFHDFWENYFDLREDYASYIGSIALEDEYLKVVADCICLFALHKLEAFSVDTHIRQALQEHYRRGFPKRRYKGFQGVLQQYIFYYELEGKTAYDTVGTAHAFR